MDGRERPRSSEFEGGFQAPNFHSAGDEIASADWVAADDAASDDAKPGDAAAAGPRSRARAAAPQAASQVDAQLAQ